MSKHYLESVFNPASVAVVCDDDYCSIGRQVLENLEASGYEGAVHAVMPRCSQSELAGHMAIHPYPADLESELILGDGREILLRPTRPEDGRKEADFVANLSAESKYFRFMHGLDKLTPAMLARFTQIDHDREMAIVAIAAGENGEDSFLGVARYVTNPDGSSCEFALAVADEWQSHGVGPKLMDRLMQIARERGLETMDGEVLAQNPRMLRLCKSLGFRSLRSPDDPEVIIVTRPL